MKKILIFALLIVPSMSFAVPSVRTLGGSNSINTPKLISGSGNKITPTKTTQDVKQNSNVATVARLGALRSKTKTNGLSGAITNSGTRFPAISSVASYSSVTTPKSESQPTIPANVDTDAIVNAVMQKVERDYYNKADVYTTNEFINAVKSVDDPRVDAIRVGAKPSHTANLPSDYVYIWVEE